MTAYLRLLLLRTRRALLSVAFGIPALAPTGILAAGLVFSNAQPRPVRGEAREIFFIACVAALLAIVVVANLTAFLVHDERPGNRGRLLRLATVDGRAPVWAHLCLAGFFASTGVATGLVLPGVYAVAQGLPADAWLRTTIVAAACATAAGPVGLWIGYLLPRTVAMVAVQVAGLAVVFYVGSVVWDVLEGGTLAFGALGWVALAHLLTLLALPPLWRRTSARLW